MSSNATTQNEASSSTSAQTTADYLRSAQFTTREGSSSAGSPDAPVTASDLFMASYDPTALHPLADLKVDYLLLDDDKTNDTPGAHGAMPSRGWSDDLCYGTGTMYLSGLIAGGLWGVKEGASRPLAVSNSRLRINSVLNSVTRRGTFIGNSAGVLALVYNGVNSSIDGFRGKHDIIGSTAAGAITGAIFKSTAGVKPAIAGAAFMSAMAGLWSFVKTSV